jgi:lysozyme
MSHPIIDLSVHQGHVDFATIKPLVREVFVRATLGYGDKDANLVHNATGAAAQGIPVSYYHFSYPHTVSDEAADAMKQANWFVDTIASLPKPQHLAVDLENFSANADATLSKEAYALWLKVFLETVEGRTGILPIIYTYADYLNRHLPTNHIFGKYPLWIANYTATHNPALPHGWTGYYMWQYNSGGVMDGIATKVDFSKLATDD